MIEITGYKNKYIDNEDGTITGYTRKGEEFLIDSEDFEDIKCHCWYLNRQSPATTLRTDAKKTTLKLSKLITKSDSVVMVINGNRADCRKENLKICVNTYEIKNDYVVGKDADGNEFYFDIDDYERVKEACYWHKHKKSGYFYGWVNGETVMMNRFIMNCNDKTKEVDHINRKRNDNRKYNLRICTPEENNRNKGVSSSNTSGYTGVTFARREQCWIAQININGKKIYLGYFTDKQDAINARKEAELKYLGEFAPQAV